MSDNTQFLTEDGRNELERELNDLVNVKRPELAERLKEAVAMGDLKENADYHDTREKISLLDGRIQHIENILRNAVIIDESQLKKGEVMVGSTVTIREDGFDEDETYKIVGPAEANPAEGRISQKSPIGAALIGKKVGAKVRCETPNGTMYFKIQRIE